PERRAPAARHATGSGLKAAAEGRSPAVRNPAQQAEAAYRSALALLAEGRVGDAIDKLRTALQADMRHAAARETLIGLLVEAGRHDEAMRELKIALTVDPRQPVLAMLLARLQIEHGGEAIETLMRTLPHAAGN